jgi:UDP-N-acetylmuramoyl-tripeptide--D-alanyl-D-alanine ligase
VGELSLKQVKDKTRGIILQGSPSLMFSSFNIDSRITQPGELFFAMKADRDGHDFISHATSKGASGVVISREIPSIPKHVGLIKVNDTLKALHEMAKQILSEKDVKVVGITGSNGKTTTKEFTAALLRERFKVLKSEKNYNNHLGLPLTLLKLSDEHEIAVLEMGMASPGEIRILTEIAPPDVSVLTGISPVHLEFFKDLEEIARAKAEILEGTRKNGKAVLNGDDDLVRKVGQAWQGKKIYFGLSPDCEISAQHIENNGFQGMSFDLRFENRNKKIFFPFLYESYVYNLLAAVGVATSLSLVPEEIVPQISKLKPFTMRGTILYFEKDIKLVDDSYNSNPKALELALRGLSPLPARRKVAVLGDMLELGHQEKEYHIKAGHQVARWGWDLLVGIGPLSKYFIQGALTSGMNKNQTLLFPDSESASQKIYSLVREGDLILVKGSRGIRTEKIVKILTERLKQRP